MSVFLPCLSVDHPDDGSGFSISAGPGTGINTEGSLKGVVGIQITHSDSPVTVTISPFPPFIGVGPNLQFWANLFGLGETRIEREKAQIQDVYTPIFQYLHNSFGVPITDNHALQFPSDGVQAQFARRPDIAALVPYLSQSADYVADQVFGVKIPGPGESERVVKQFLANAAYNNWPVSAATQIWDGIVDAAQPGCSADPARWLRNPMIVEAAAQMGVLLQYIPLTVLADMAVQHAIGSYLAEQVILQWAQNPSLVQSIAPIQQYDWQGIYTRGEWALPPYGSPFGGTIPLLQRDHILPIIQGISFQRPWYPNFLDPVAQQPVPLPQPQPIPTPVPQPPELPPVQQPSPLPPVQQPSPVPPVQQPSPVPVPQPIPPTQGQIGEIPPAQHDGVPNQSDLDYACYYLRLWRLGQEVPLAFNNWMLSAVGTAAVKAMWDDPACGQHTAPRDQPYPPQDPQCPVWNPQGPRPQPSTPPVIVGQPPSEPPPCPTPCQDQIDLLRQQQKECCDELTYNVLPRLTDVETWLISLEARVPGPAPELPFPYPQPPVGNLPPTDLPPPGVLEIPPVVQPPEPAPVVIDCEQIIECIITHCEQVNTILKACTKEEPQDPCAEGRQKWGKWAECWLNANTFNPPFAAVVLPNPITQDYAVSSMVEILQAEPGTVLGGRIDEAAQRFAQIVAGDFSVAGQVFSAGQPRPSFIYEETF